MKAVKLNTINKRQQHQMAVQAAMPDVREVVKKHGLTMVNSCLSKLREFDKKARKAEQLRQEAEKLERELEGDKPRVKSA